MKKRTVALLSGGISSEREVSLNSGNQVFEALDKEKYRVIRYDPKTDLPRLVAEADDIDVALVILHGPFGEDGTIQGLFEMIGLPFVGCDAASSAVCMDKIFCKSLLDQAGLQTPPWQVIDRASWTEHRERLIGLSLGLGLPLFVKPARLGSSVGISKVVDRGELAPAVAQALALGPHDPITH